MQAVDVMTPDVISATPDTPLAELVRLMLDNQISGVPIVEDETIVGIVTEGDLLRRAETGTEAQPSWWLELISSSDHLAAGYAKAHGRRAREIMTRDVVTVTDAAPISEVAHLLQAKRIKRVPVTRNDRLAGIISRRNLLQVLAARLAEAPVTADDRSIREAFYAELQRQPWAAPSAISAVVANQVVYLWGAAPGEVQRQAIIVVAQNIPGVRAVEDHMGKRRTVDPLNRPNWPSAGRP